MSLSEYDRLLLDRCLQRAPRSWEDFVERFLGLVIHVVNHTAHSRGQAIDQPTRDDVVADVFLCLIENDFAILRRFRRQCSLHTYLTVIARRIAVGRLQTIVRTFLREGTSRSTAANVPSNGSEEARIDDQEEVEKLLLRLDSRDANVVRMFHLEGRSYDEISNETGIAANTIGPLLSRARKLLRESREN